LLRRYAPRNDTGGGARCAIVVKVAASPDQNGRTITMMTMMTISSVGTSLAMR
jgi:hypothetical protein